MAEVYETGGMIADMERACDVVTDLGHVVVTIRRERYFQDRKRSFYQRIAMLNRGYKAKKTGKLHV